MFPENSLLAYLIKNPFQDVEDFVELLDYIKTAKEEMVYAAEHPEEYDYAELDDLKDELENWEKEYQETIDAYKKINPNADIEKEIEKIKKWNQDKAVFMEGREQDEELG